VKAHGKGRVFYGSLGHNPKVFQDPKLLRFYLDGIQFALGDIEADTTPSGPLPASARPKVQTLAPPKDGLVNGYLVAWEYAGPYTGPDAFDMPFAPEQPAAKDVAWKPMPFGLDRARTWVLPFDRLSGVQGNQRAVYVRTNVFSPEAQKARMTMGSDDGITVWLNGAVAHANNATRGLSPDSDQKTVQLRKGWNVLLAKVTQGGGEWAACLALRTEKGEPLPGLRSEAGAPKIPVTMPTPRKVFIPGPDFVEKYTGEYAGQLTVDGAEGPGLAQVIAEGRGRYRAVLLRELWKTDPKAKQFRVELSGTLDDDGNVPLEGSGWTGTLVGQKTLTAKAEKGKFEGVWAVRKSPTLAAKPPEGAIVLLPFEEGKKPSLKEWSNQNWLALDTGAAQVHGGTNFTVRKFGSARFHVESRCPYEPLKRGQGRGNSGVYLQKRYEVQVLESFGLRSRNNDCGSIYNVATTGVNACLPPLQWQTYDIEFTAAKVGAGGKITRPPTMTVRHNGILIHKDQVLPGKTTAAAASGLTQADSLMLQDHGNAVQYRNIWAVPSND